MGICGGCYGFLTGDLDNSVTSDVMDHIDWSQGRYPESFMLISLSEVYQEPSVLDGGIWGLQGFLTGDLEDRVILDIMDHLWGPQRRYPESFMLISLLEVCQEPPVLDGGTWRMLRVPDRWLWGTPRNISWKFCVIIFIFGWVMRVCYHSNKNVTGIDTQWKFI